MSIVRKKIILLGLVAPLACGFLSQCNVTSSIQGFSANDFSTIMEYGLGAEDFAQDHNEYAWSMDYFVPDGASEGFLYVGTCNNLGQFTLARMMEALGSGSVDDLPFMQPEIVRYRPEQGSQAWETVLDFRDIPGTDEYRTLGFRYMTQYRAQSDGVNYLYASTMGDYPAIWRSATGEPGSWTEAWRLEQFGSIRYMEEHNGILYIAVANDDPYLPAIGTIWATDGATYWKAIDDGFGNADNREIECLISWNGWLYAGTSNYATGYEIWRFAGPDRPVAEAVRVVAYGGPD